MNKYASRQSDSVRTSKKRTAPPADIPNSSVSAELRHTQKPDTANANAQTGLDAAMRQRVSGVAGRLQPQIPVAEHEADRLSASVTASDPEGVKAELGEKLGADFSGVRFHSDASARGGADSIGARAYTAGHDVYFGEGGFDPSVAAHELVHTVQQGEVQSETATVSAPAGGIQMLPKFLKKAKVGIKEFVGGKMGKVGKPSEAEMIHNMDEVNKGDLSMAARTSKDSRSIMTSKSTYSMAQRLMANPQLTAQQIANQFNTTRSLNPFDRQALSLLAKGDAGTPPSIGMSASGVRQQAPKLREAQELIDQKMMIDTMMGPSQVEKDRVFHHYKDYDDQELLDREYKVAKEGKQYLGTEGGPQAYDTTQQLLAERRAGGKRSDANAQKLAQDDLTQAQRSGDAMLNMMFLMQLGKFDKTTKEKIGGKNVKQKSAWDMTMANAFAHGGRTAFVMGAGEGKNSSEKVLDEVFGMGSASPLEKRSAATHHLAMPRAGAGTKGLKEGSGAINGFYRSKHDSWFQHRGMNMAIGGIGKLGGAGPADPTKPGVPIGTGMMINAQGRNGHMYVGSRRSTKTTKGGILAGLESDSPYRMNQTGHMHNAAAAAEEGSSTGGLKTDLVGEKYGGRTVDLSAIPNAQLAELTGEFSSHIQTLRGSSQKADQDELLRLVTLMSGKQMDPMTMVDEIGKFSQHAEKKPGDNRKRIMDLVGRGRIGSDFYETKAPKKKK